VFQLTKRHLTNNVNVHGLIKRRK